MRVKLTAHKGKRTSPGRRKIARELSLRMVQAHPFVRERGG